MKYLMKFNESLKQITIPILNNVALLISYEIVNNILHSHDNYIDCNYNDNFKEKDEYITMFNIYILNKSEEDYNKILKFIEDNNFKYINTETNTYRKLIHFTINNDKILELSQKYEMLQNTKKYNL